MSLGLVEFFLMTEISQVIQEMKRPKVNEIHGKLVFNFIECVIVEIRLFF